MLKLFIFLTTLYEYFCSDHDQSIVKEDFYMSKDKLIVFISSYYLEIFIFFIIVYFLIKLICYKKNKYVLYAKSWYKVNKDFFASQYEVMGFGNKQNKEFEILEEDNRTFKFSASGRIHVKWVICLMIFGKKNYLSCTNKDRDKLIYKISLDSNNQLPTVFCLCSRNDINDINNNHLDIKAFTKTYSPQFISEKLILMAENFEIFNEIFQRVIDSYKSVENHIEMIYYSDQEIEEQFTLYFSFHINFKETIKNNERIFLEFTKFVHNFIDIISMYQISTNFKKDAFSRRINTVRKIDGTMIKNGKKIKNKKK